MEDIFTSSLSTNHHFAGSNLDNRNFELDAYVAGGNGGGGGGPRRTSHRHHSNSSSGNPGYERGGRFQGENDYLKDRVRSFEKGMGKLYQVVLNARKRAENPPTFNHKRSASLSYQYETGHSPSDPSPLPDPAYNGYGMEYDESFNPVPQLSMSELQASIEKLVSDRDCLLSEVDDLRQITDAAKRERVLAIDEKDQLLRESHSLRVTADSLQSALNEAEETRDRLSVKVRNLKEELVSVKRDNEKANELRSLAMEERLKMIAECSELQQELRAFQSERDDLYKETRHQQSLLDELSEEKRKLEQDLDWLSKNSGGVVNGCGFEKRGSGYDELPRRHSGSTGSKEDKPGPTYDVLEVLLKRSASGMPWGFTFEGGRGTEFYHQDPSIVITGLANHTTAAHVLRFGDRILMFGNNDFRNITRKEAVEMIRSCDLTAITLEIGRAQANIKPAPQEVRIPGKKDFGFSYESRLFVTSTEEESHASDILLPGDEILQVQGKSAFNMKPSALKQLLKSCKDGVVLTVQRQPGINVTTMGSLHGTGKTRFSSSASPSGRARMREGNSLLPLGGGSGANGSSGRGNSSQRFSCELVTSPGTPKSSISESSAGYHSLTHSLLPSDSTNQLLPVGPDSKTGQIGPEHEQGGSPVTTPTSGGLHRGGMVATRPRYSSDSSNHYHHHHHHHHGNSGEEMGGVRPGSAVGGGTISSSASSSSNGLNRSSYRNRPADYYSRSPRRNTTSNTQPSRSRTTSLLPKPRTYSMTSAYRSVPNIHPDHIHHYAVQPHRMLTPVSPGLRPITSAIGQAPPMSSLLGANNASGKPFSMSADNLDSDPCPVSMVTTPTSTCEPRGKPPIGKEVKGHLAAPNTYSRGILSISMSNMQTHV